MLTAANCITHALNGDLADIKRFIYRSLICLCFSKITHLQKSCISLLYLLRLSFSCETQRMMTEMVQISKTDMHSAHRGTPLTFWRISQHPPNPSPNYKQRLATKFA